MNIAAILGNIRFCAVHFTSTWLGVRCYTFWIGYYTYVMYALKDGDTLD